MLETVPNPLWSYELGWLNDWIPKDPQDSLGTCQSTPAQLSIEAPEAVAWSPPLAAWMTGGSGAGEIPASATANFSVWPPTSLTELPNVANLYTYTATGTPITMSADLPATASANGWANPSDTAGYFVPVAGCDYPNAYSGYSMSAPTAPPCPNGANAARRLAREIRPTPAPKF
jgi:glucan 1,3-beta-glucosidase